MDWLGGMMKECTTDEMASILYNQPCVSVFCMHGGVVCIVKGYGQPFCPSSVHLTTSRC